MDRKKGSSRSGKNQGANAMYIYWWMQVMRDKKTNNNMTKQGQHILQKVKPTSITSSMMINKKATYSKYL